jgi:hypothetical protein
MSSIHPKAPAFEALDSDKAKQHLNPHGVILREETLVRGQIHFSFFEPINNWIELLQKI